jgi:hypothetical protein
MAAGSGIALESAATVVVDKLSRIAPASPPSERMVSNIYVRRCCVSALVVREHSKRCAAGGLLSRRYVMGPDEAVSTRCSRCQPLLICTGGYPHRTKSGPAYDAAAAQAFPIQCATLLHLADVGRRLADFRIEVNVLHRYLPVSEFVLSGLCRSDRMPRCIARGVLVFAGVGIICSS